MSNYDYPDLPAHRPQKLKKNQAERLLSKFGGPYRFCKLLKTMNVNLAPSTVFRWKYPKHKGGTGGLIPAYYWPYILKLARVDGIILTELDFDPREY